MFILGEKHGANHCSFQERVTCHLAREQHTSLCLASRPVANSACPRWPVSLSGVPQKPRQGLRQLDIEHAVPLRDILPKELKTGTKTNIFTRMLTAALFTVTKRGDDQTVYPHVNSGVKRGPSTAEYYPAVKRNEALTYATAGFRVGAVKMFWN